MCVCVGGCVCVYARAHAFVYMCMFGVMHRCSCAHSAIGVAKRGLFFACRCHRARAEKGPKLQLVSDVLVLSSSVRRHNCWWPMELKAMSKSWGLDKGQGQS